jgi:hypothetical protein
MSVCTMDVDEIEGEQFDRGSDIRVKFPIYMYYGTCIEPEYWPLICRAKQTDGHLIRDRSARSEIYFADTSQ